MAKFKISSHGRLQDWIAAENGYFDEEGLDYEFSVRTLEIADQGVQAQADVRTGAYEQYKAGIGGKKDMSAACHWAVNQAASDNAGRMWGKAYGIVPSGIYVPLDSDIRKPEDLADTEVAVGHHSGSHFSTIQALEPFLDTSAIKLSFLGYPYDRVDALLSGTAPAAAVWGASVYLVEQLGCRKVLDTTFMLGFMFNPEIDSNDVERYFNALKRAQMALDLEPERYKHHYLEEIPNRYHEQIDVRTFGTGERVVNLPYTAEAYEHSQHWMEERGLFEQAEGGGQELDYETVVQS